MRKDRKSSCVECENFQLSLPTSHKDVSAVALSCLEKNGKRSRYIYIERKDTVLPQAIRCGKCRSILYEGMELKSPFEIIELYEGKCPKCSKRLSSVPIEVKVTRISEE